MKKLFLFVFAIFAVSAVSAQSISHEGDITVLKNTFPYDLRINYDNLKVNGITVEEFLPTMDEKFRNDWDADIVVFSESVGKSIPILMNKKNTLDPTNAQYIFDLKLNSLTLGNVSGMFNPFTSNKSGGSIISGTLEVFEASTNSSVLVITFDEIQGLSNISDKMRWSLAYVELAKRLKKIVKKAK